MSSSPLNLRSSVSCFFMSSTFFCKFNANSEKNVLKNKSLAVFLLECAVSSFNALSDMYPIFSFLGFTKLSSVLKVVSLKFIIFVLVINGERIFLYPKPTLVPCVDFGFKYISYCICFSFTIAVLSLILMCLLSISSLTQSYIVLTSDNIELY